MTILDEIFEAVERHARRASRSRSQLYAAAVSEYLTRHAPDEVTGSMNRVVDQIEEPTDPFVEAAARRVLESTAW